MEEGSVKPRMPGPTSGISESVALGSGLGVYISNKIPGAADATGPGTTPWEPLPKFASEPLY